MIQKKQNPGGQARVSRDPIVETSSRVPFSLLERQAQTLKARFLVTGSFARTLARFCYGEAPND